MTDGRTATGGSGQYVFPRESRCPACGSSDTVAYHTKGPIQYRKCRACGQRYSVGGTLVKIPDW
ncbi:MAG: hypothetical protein QM570_15450 [Planctomycetota bacterium]|nr:hypothetical protein [Planctomycetota bacterium]